MIDTELIKALRGPFGYAATQQAADRIEELVKQLDEKSELLDKAMKDITPNCLNCKHYFQDSFGDFNCRKKCVPWANTKCENWEWHGGKRK